MDTKNLTVRHLDTLALYASGLSGPQIAETLYLSHHTIKGHFKSIKKITGASNLSQCIAWCVATGLLKVHRDGTVRRKIV